MRSDIGNLALPAKNCRFNLQAMEMLKQMYRSVKVKICQCRLNCDPLNNTPIIKKNFTFLICSYDTLRIKKDLRKLSTFFT